MTKKIKIPPADVSIPLKMKLWALALAMTGFLLYVNTANNSYALDDNNSIIQNNYVQEGISGIPGLMTIDYWHFQGLHLGYYRPLSLISFAIEKSFVGNDPHFSHLINALLYGLTGFLLFLFLLQLFPAKHPAFSFLICLLFIAHPIHTEVVANIKSRDEILSFLNILAMCFFAYRYFKTNKTKDLAWSLIFTYLALLSKETAMLGVALLALFMVFSGHKIEATLKKIWPFAAVILFFLLQKQYFLQGSTKKIPTDITNYPYVAAAVKLPSSFHIFWLYIQKLIIPSPLCYDYSYNQIPASHGADAVVWLGVVALAALVIIFFRGFSQKTNLSLASGVFLITISPAIAFVMLRGGIMAERFLYAPVLGFAIALVYLLSKKTGALNKSQVPLPEWIRSNKELVLVSLLLFSVYSYATIKRNPDWKDNMTLFGTDVKKATNSTQAHRLYGNELITEAKLTKDTALKRKDFIAGMNELRRSAEINPKFGETYEQMGYAYSEVYLNIDSALYYYKKCISVSNFALAYNNLGALYQNLGRLSLASWYYNKALEINPNQPDALKHSAELKKQTGLDVHVFPGEDKRDAELLGKVRSNQSSHPAPQVFKALFDSGAALVDEQKYAQAIKYFEKALTLQPKNMDNLLYLANCYGLTNNFQKAINIYNKMLSVTPFDTVIMNDLALTYLKNGQKEKSEQLIKNVRSYRKN